MRRKTLQGRLLAYFALAALIPAAVVMLIYLGMTQADTTSRLQEDGALRAAHAVAKIENKVNQINDFAGWIFRNEQICALLERSEEEAAVYDEACHEAVRALREQFSYRPVARHILALFLIGDNGLDLRSGTEASLISREEACALLADNGDSDLYWGSLIDNPTALSANRQVIFYRHPLTDPRSGEHTGWLVLLFSGKMFEEECADLLTGEGSRSVLYNSEGGVLSVLGAPASEEERMTVQAESLSTGWRLQVELSDESLAAQRLATLLSTLLLALLTAGLAALLAWFLSRNLSRPVGRIMQTVARMAQGDFSDNHPVPTDESELGQLERHVGDMGDSIARLMDEQLAREQEKRKLEIQMLQNQLNPHFLYNTLNSIKVMATLQGKTGIRNMIEALGRLLRANLSAQEDTVPLGSELELLDSYVYIQNTSFKGRIGYRRENVTPDTLDCSVPRFLLQPLVENAILHGLAPKPQGGVVEIAARIENGRLIVTVADDGVGMEAEALAALRARLSGEGAGDADSHGVGLGNTARRLRLQYEDAVQIEVDSEPGAGTSVRIELPAERERGDENGR